MIETWIVLGVVLGLATVFGVTVALVKRAKERVRPSLYNYTREICIWLRVLGVLMVTAAIIGASAMIASAL